MVGFRLAAAAALLAGSALAVPAQAAQHVGAQTPSDLGPGIEQQVPSGQVLQRAGSGTVTPFGTCTLAFCGTVRNASNSDTDLWIINNWPPENADGAFVPPGGTSRSYFKDTDGFYVPTGCKAVRDWAPDLSGGSWYKINDLFNETIRLDC
ncbi:MAG: hypothetical protein QG608_190 [Actinomycetota bacterium]|nr:hypothetical protein [Actinomycetota bacterium]